MNYRKIDEYCEMDFENRIGFILFKPDCPISEIKIFKEYCILNNINILKNERITLGHAIIISIYNSLFNSKKTDNKYGIKWKNEVIKYLIGRDVEYIFVENENIHKILFKYRLKLRKKYGKVTNPKVKMNNIDFKKKVIRNIVHIHDKVDMQSLIWLLI